MSSKVPIHTRSPCPECFETAVSDYPRWFCTKKILKSLRKLHVTTSPWAIDVNCAEHILPKEIPIDSKALERSLKYGDYHGWTLDATYTLMENIFQSIHATHPTIAVARPYIRIPLAFKEKFIPMIPSLVLTSCSVPVMVLTLADRLNESRFNYGGLKDYIERLDGTDPLNFMTLIAVAQSQMEAAKKGIIRNPKGTFTAICCFSQPCQRMNFLKVTFTQHFLENFRNGEPMDEDIMVMDTAVTITQDCKELITAVKVVAAACLDLST